MDKDGWIGEVVKLAKSYGYSARQVLVFQGDILDCFNKGMTPEECVSKVF